MSKENKMLLALEINIVWLIVIESIFCFYFTDNIPRFILGAIMGTVTSFLFVRSLYKSIEISLDLNEDDAVKYYKKKAIQRTIMIAGVIIAAMLLARFVSVLAVFLGIMNVKFSAYIQPLTNKYVLTKFSEKGR